MAKAVLIYQKGEKNKPENYQCVIDHNCFHDTSACSRQLGSSIMRHLERQYRLTGAQHKFCLTEKVTKNLADPQLILAI